MFRGKFWSQLWRGAGGGLVICSMIFGACTESRPRSTNDDDGQTGAAGAGGTANIPGIPVACSDLINCATEDGSVPLTPILEEYGQNGTCYDNFPEDACAQDCAAIMEGLSCTDTCGVDANGWPTNTSPPGYVGSGFNVGEQFINFMGAADQYGNTNVSLGQFYGGMVLVSIGAAWAPPSAQAAASSQALMDNINASTSSYNFWMIQVLVDGESPGVSSQLADGESWALQYGIEHPVLIGSSASSIAPAQAVPTFYILDPEFQVRDVIDGYPGDDALFARVNTAFNSFSAGNSSWQNPCP